MNGHKPAPHNAPPGSIPIYAALPKGHNALAALVTDILDEHRPETATERKIAEAMAVAKWRQMRAWEMGDAALTEEMLSRRANRPETANQLPAARVFSAFREIADSGRAMILMNRYEARYERLYGRSLKLLLRLRAERQSAEPDMEDEAAAPVPIPQQCENETGENEACEYEKSEAPA